MALEDQKEKFLEVHEKNRHLQKKKKRQKGQMKYQNSAVKDSQALPECAFQIKGYIRSILRWRLKCTAVFRLAKIFLYILSCLPPM